MNTVWKRGERDTADIHAMLGKHGVKLGASLLELGADNGRVVIPPG